MSFIQQTFNPFKSYYPTVVSQISQLWSTHSCSLIKTMLVLTLVVSHAPFIPNDIEKADNEPQLKNDINYAYLFRSRKLLQCSVTAPLPVSSPIPSPTPLPTPSPTITKDPSIAATKDSSKSPSTPPTKSPSNYPTNYASLVFIIMLFPFKFLKASKPLMFILILVLNILLVGTQSYPIYIFGFTTCSAYWCQQSSHNTMTLYWNGEMYQCLVRPQFLETKYQCDQNKYIHCASSDREPSFYGIQIDNLNKADNFGVQFLHLTVKNSINDTVEYLQSGVVGVLANKGVLFSIDPDEISSSPSSVVVPAISPNCPTQNPTLKPTNNPTKDPPSATPTTSPSDKPTMSPSNNHTMYSTTSPSKNPTELPSNNPTTSSSKNPTILPSVDPTYMPTTSPSGATIQPTSPSKYPTISPTSHPTTNTINQTTSPSIGTIYPTNNPTVSPSNYLSITPTLNPSINPSVTPSVQPTVSPTTHHNVPSKQPTITPSNNPTTSPSKNSTILPSVDPTISSANNPTTFPSDYPTKQPSKGPTKHPTDQPSETSTKDPSVSPTKDSSINETKDTSISPTKTSIDETIDSIVNPISHISSGSKASTFTTADIVLYTLLSTIVFLLLCVVICFGYYWKNKVKMSQNNILHYPNDGYNHKPNFDRNAVLFYDINTANIDENKGANGELYEMNEGVVTETMKVTNKNERKIVICCKGGNNNELTLKFERHLNDWDDVMYTKLLASIKNHIGIPHETELTLYEKVNDGCIDIDDITDLVDAFEAQDDDERCILYVDYDIDEDIITIPK